MTTNKFESHDWLKLKIKKFSAKNVVMAPKPDHPDIQGLSIKSLTLWL